jgi:hypothetical protein
VPWLVIVWCRECIERVQMAQGEYEALRRDPTHFAIKSGHEINDVEAIVANNERYIVVAKLGAAARAATHLDSRPRKVPASH